MIDYKKVSKSLAYLIETMNGFQDEVLKYKYSIVLVHYKNYIEKYNSNGGFYYHYLQVKRHTEGKHNNYLYFPHLKEECEVVFDELVNIETVSQFQHKLLVDAGMDATTEPVVSDGNGINVTFQVTPEVAEKYNSLLEYDISEWKLIIAQSE